MTEISFICPYSKSNMDFISDDTASYRARNGRTYACDPQSGIPIFYPEYTQSNEYTHAEAAAFHDNALAWLFETFQTDEPTIREDLISRLELLPEQAVLITGAGAGNDIPYIARHLQGRGQIHAQDIALDMLQAAQSRSAQDLSSDTLSIVFSQSDAGHLPYADSVFDVAYHFGGINLFNDIQAGMAEMARVVKPGGRVLIGDEGLAPWLTDTQNGKMLINNNALYASPVPLSALPVTAQDVKISWIMENCFYLIQFTVGHASPQINPDVPHKGRRGGSIHKRYFGQLEAIDPKIKAQLYEKADRLGISRSQFLEKLLKIAIED